MNSSRSYACQLLSKLFPNLKSTSVHHCVQNCLTNFQYTKQKSSIQSYFLEDFIEIKMAPKRKRSTKKKVAIVDEDISDVEEKPAIEKRHEVAALKSSTRNAKNKVIRYKDDGDDNEDDDNDRSEDRKIKTKSNKKRKNDNVEKPTHEAAASKSSSRNAKNKAVRYKVDDDNEDDDNDDSDDRKIETKGNKKRKDDNVEKPPPAKKVKAEPKLLNPIFTDLSKINYDCDKLNKNGKKYNLKICCWNVSGVRAVVKKHGMDYIKKEDADIVALQETKCNIDNLPKEGKLPGYKHYYLDSERPGYCGVALYCKNDKEPINIKYGLNNANFDKEGRIITAEFDDFYVVNVYVPNCGYKLVNLAKRLQWNEEFKSHVKKLDKKKPVIICGDMNVAHEEIDLKNPKANMGNAGFTKEERDGMTDLLKQGFVDTFRHFYPDKTGAYTFWSYFAESRAKNIGWRLDYYIVSKSIKDDVCDSVMRSTVKGSDHCPIVLYINL